MHELRTKFLGRQAYSVSYEKMHQFTHERTESTVDELWILEHDPVFTQGRAGKVEHLLDAGDIPVFQSDRGGQITYHGPGQLIVYPLINLQNWQLNVREWVRTLEEAAIDFLDRFDIKANAKKGAPGIYIGEKKIASLGLRIRKHCSLHGIAINLNMDLAPFSRINPCGYHQLEMVQLRQYVREADLPSLSEAGCLFVECLRNRLTKSISE